MDKRRFGMVEKKFLKIIKKIITISISLLHRIFKIFLIIMEGNDFPWSGYRREDWYIIIVFIEVDRPSACDIHEKLTKRSVFPLFLDFGLPMTQIRHGRKKKLNNGYFLTTFWVIVTPSSKGEFILKQYIPEGWGARSTAIFWSDDQSNSKLASVRISLPALSYTLILLGIHWLCIWSNQVVSLTGNHPYSLNGASVNSSEDWPHHTVTGGDCHQDEVVVLLLLDPDTFSKGTLVYISCMLSCHWIV